MAIGQSGTIIVTSMQEGLFVPKKRVRPVRVDGFGGGWYRPERGRRRADGCFAD